MGDSTTTMTDIAQLRAAVDAASNDRDRVVAMTALISAYMSTDPRQALTLASAGLALATQLHDERLMATCLVNMGIANNELGNYDGAMEQLQQARAIFEKLGEMRGLAKTMSDMGTTQLKLGQYGNAMIDYRSAIAIAEEHGAHDIGVQARLGMGVVYQDLGDWAMALETYQRALIQAEDIGHHVAVEIAMGNIASIYQGLGQHEKALQQFQAARELAEARGARLGWWDGVIGEVFHTAGEYSKAIEHLRSAIMVQDEVGHRESVGRFTNSLGNAYLALGDYAKALKHYQSSLAIAEEIGDRSQLAYSTMNVGRVYAAPSFNGYEPSEAKHYLIRAIELATAISLKSCLLSAHKELAEFYQQQGKWRQACEHLAKHYELEKEVHSHEAHKKAQQLEHHKALAEMEKQRAIEQAEAQAAQLRAQLLESQLQRKQHELASTAMSLARQTELLGRFRNDLRSIIHNNANAASIVEQFKGKLKELPCEAIDWTKFETEFRQSYPEFQQKLFEKHPTLTEMEVKICTLLKLRLTSLDMSQLLCLSERTVEWHRAKIRRKLGVERGRDVYEALAGV